MKYFELTTKKWSYYLALCAMYVLLPIANITAQNPPCSLACNGNTQVSLDVDCQALITADMILNDQVTSCPNGNYVVTVSNVYGDIPNPVSANYIGQDLYAKVTDTNSGNSCWGNIYLEDKLGPIIESCPGTVEVACSELAAYEGPIYYDPCEGYKDAVLLSETVTPYSCDPRYVKSVTRVYTAYDSKNNRAPECTIVYNLLRFDFDDVNCPPDYAQYPVFNACGFNYNTLSCDGKWRFGQFGSEYDTDLDGDGILDKDVYWDDNDNNYPDPLEVGVPTITTEINGLEEEVALYPFPDVYCNTVVTFEDIEYPRIGCTKKIVRLWVMREWHCTTEVLDTIRQVIEIVDDIPPVLECPGFISTTTNVIMGSVNTSYGNVTCGANTAIPLPQADDNCSPNSGLTFDVTYPGGFQGNYNGALPIILPMGTNEVLFTVYDECYNSSSCSVLVEIQDNTPPVTVCDQYTAVSLTTGGEAVVNASSFDDGSYDDCKAHCMLVRRMTPGDCDCKLPKFCGLDFVGEHDGSYYYLSSYKTTATIAKNRAKAYGGNVVIFEDEVEEEWLLSSIRPTFKDNFWIGMKRFGSNFLWDDHSGLSYENWAAGNPSGAGGLNYSFLAPNLGNTILFSDGATISNGDDMVSNIRLVNGPTSNTIDIHWNWYAPSTGSYTAENGINMKLLHYDGNSWVTIYSERYTGSNTTNTIEDLLDQANNGFYRYKLPANNPCGINYFRIAIEDNSFEWDIIQGNFSTGDDGSDYDNADVSFMVSSSQCSEDCVIMDEYNQWDDTGCLNEYAYILEITDICGFSEIANFCCSDVGTDQMVSFRVVDIFGNYNDCMVNVDIQDKVAPSLICPPNTTVDCDIPFDPQSLSIAYGTPILSDDCGATVTEEGINELTNCNLGTYTRVFTATDDGGRSSSCKQVLTFVNPNPFSAQLDVDCPRDTVIIGCMAPEELGPDIFGYPEFINERCGLLGTDWDDEVFTFNSTNGDACFKILRTWEIIDWCQPNLPVWSCVQVIKVTNGDKPIISGCETKEVCTYDSECLDGYIELEVSAVDSCTDASNLRWRYSVYAGELGVGPKSFGTPIAQDSGDGNIANASGEYPIGTHIVRWTFFDRCGNATTCDQEFTIANCKAPTAYCINGLAVNLMPMDIDGDGESDFAMVELWASDFDAGSHHPCGYEVTLSFSPDSLVPNIMFDCTTRGDQEVSIWASVVGFDGELIQSFCTSVVNVQDNNDACQGQKPETVNVGGTVFTEDLENVNNVEVNLVGSNLIGMTDANGEYAFDEMPLGGDYIVMPKLNDNPLNGVSTLDIIEIQRHLLGLDELSSPYKIIAADVNKDFRITSVDLLELRKLILGVYNDFPNNDSWRFVDNAYNFLDPRNPLNEDFKESYLISKLSTDMDIDFVAVKVGDVNDNSSVNRSESVSEQSNSVAELIVNDFEFQEGELINIPISIENEPTRGFQFALSYDTESIEILSIESKSSDFDKNNYRIYDNEIAISWNTLEDHVQTAELFNITAIAKSNGKVSDLLELGSGVIDAELYDEKGMVKTPQLVSKSIDSHEFKLFQNIPNPFSENTEVNFNLNSSGLVNIRVSDVQGRVIKSISTEFDKGFNTYIINSNDLGRAGVYYLTLSTAAQSATIKMVVLR